MSSSGGNVGTVGIEVVGMNVQKAVAELKKFVDAIGQLDSKGKTATSSINSSFGNISNAVSQGTTKITSETQKSTQAVTKMGTDVQTSSKKIGTSFDTVAQGSTKLNTAAENTKKLSMQMQTTAGNVTKFDQGIKQTAGSLQQYSGNVNNVAQSNQKLTSSTNQITQATNQARQSIDQSKQSVSGASQAHGQLGNTVQQTAQKTTQLNTSVKGTSGSLQQYGTVVKQNVTGQQQFKIATEQTVPSLNKQKEELKRVKDENEKLKQSMVTSRQAFAGVATSIATVGTSVVSLYNAYDSLGSAQEYLEFRQVRLDAWTMRLRDEQEKLNEIVREGGEGSKEYADQLEKVNFVERQREVRVQKLDDAQKDLNKTYLNFATQAVPSIIGVGASIGGLVNSVDILRKAQAAGKVVTDAATASTSLGTVANTAHARSVTAIGTASAASTPAVHGLTAAIKGMNLATSLGIGAILTAVATIAMYSTNTLGARDAINSFGESVGNLIPEFKPFGDMLVGIAGTLGMTGETAEETEHHFEQMRKGIVEQIDAVSEAGDGLTTSYHNMMAEMQRSNNTVVANVANTIINHTERMRTTGEEAASQLEMTSKTFGTFIDQLSRGDYQEAVDTFLEALSDIPDVAGAAFSSFIVNITGFGRDVGITLADIGTKIQAAAIATGEWWNEVNNQISGGVTAAIGFVDELIGRIVPNWGEIKSEVSQWVDTNITTPLTDWWADVSIEADNLWNMIIKQGGIVSQVTEWVDTNIIVPLTAWWDDIELTPEGIWNSILGAGTSIVSRVDSWVIENISNPLMAWWDNIHIGGDGIWGSILGTVSTIGDTVTTWVNTNIVDPIKKFPENITSLIGDVIKAIGLDPTDPESATEISNKITTWSTAVWEEIKKLPNHIGNLVGDIIGAILGTSEESTVLSTEVDTWLNDIWEEIKKLPDKVLNLGVEIVKKLLGGGWVTEVVNWINGIWGVVEKTVLGKKAPDETTIPTSVNEGSAKLLTSNQLQGGKAAIDPMTLSEAQDAGIAGGGGNVEPWLQESSFGGGAVGGGGQSSFNIWLRNKQIEQQKALGGNISFVSGEQGVTDQSLQQGGSWNVPTENQLDIIPTEEAPPVVGTAHATEVPPPQEFRGFPITEDLDITTDIETITRALQEYQKLEQTVEQTRQALNRYQLVLDSTSGQELLAKEAVNERTAAMQALETGLIKVTASNQEYARQIAEENLLQKTYQKALEDTKTEVMDSAVALADFAGGVDGMIKEMETGIPQMISFTQGIYKQRDAVTQIILGNQEMKGTIVELTGQLQRGEAQSAAYTQSLLEQQLAYLKLQESTSALYGTFDGIITGLQDITTVTNLQKEAFAQSLVTAAEWGETLVTSQSSAEGLTVGVINTAKALGVDLPDSFRGSTEAMQEWVEMTYGAGEAFDSFIDSIQKGGANIISGLGDAIQKSNKDFGDAIEKMEEEMGFKFSNSLTNAFEAQAGIDAISNTSILLLEAIDSLGTDITPENFNELRSGMTDNIRETLDDVDEELGPNAEGLINNLINTLNKPVDLSPEGIRKWMGEVKADLILLAGEGSATAQSMLTDMGAINGIKFDAVKQEWVDVHGNIVDYKEVAQLAKTDTETLATSMDTATVSTGNLSASFLTATEQAEKYKTAIDATKESIASYEQATGNVGMFANADPENSIWAQETAKHTQPLPGTGEGEEAGGGQAVAVDTSAIDEAMAKLDLFNQSLGAIPTNIEAIVSLSNEYLQPLADPLTVEGEVMQKLIDFSTVLGAFPEGITTDVVEPTNEALIAIGDPFLNEIPQKILDFTTVFTAFPDTINSILSGVAVSFTSHFNTGTQNAAGSVNNLTSHVATKIGQINTVIGSVAPHMTTTFNTGTQNAAGMLTALSNHNATVFQNINDVILQALNNAIGYFGEFANQSIAALSAIDEAARIAAFAVQQIGELARTSTGQVNELADALHALPNIERSIIYTVSVERDSSAVGMVAEGTVAMTGQRAIVGENGRELVIQSPLRMENGGLAIGTQREPYVTNGLQNIDISDSLLTVIPLEGRNAYNFAKKHPEFRGIQEMFMFEEGVVGGNQANVTFGGAVKAGDVEVNNGTISFNGNIVIENGFIKDFQDAVNDFSDAVDEGTNTGGGGVTGGRGIGTGGTSYVPGAGKPVDCSQCGNTGGGGGTGGGNTGGGGGGTPNTRQGQYNFQQNINGVQKFYEYNNGEVKTNMSEAEINQHIPAEWRPTIGTGGTGNTGGGNTGGGTGNTGGGNTGGGNTGGGGGTPNTGGGGSIPTGSDNPRDYFDFNEQTEAGEVLAPTGYAHPPYIQTSGSGDRWKGQSWNPNNWQAVKMEDDPTKWKVIDVNGKNIAANFNDKAGAQEWIDDHKTMYNGGADINQTPTTGGGNVTSGGGAGGTPTSGNEFGHVQTHGGSKWTTDPEGPYEIVRMEDDRNKWKIIDSNRKNVAANFNSKEEAERYLQHYGNTLPGYTGTVSDTGPPAGGVSSGGNVTPNGGSTGGGTGAGTDFSHVVTSGGSKWAKKGEEGDPSTWESVPMTDAKHKGKYKLVNKEGKNVAANFNSELEADQYQQYRVSGNTSGGESVTGGAGGNVTPGGGGSTGGGTSTQPQAENLELLTIEGSESVGVHHDLPSHVPMPKTKSGRWVADSTGANTWVEDWFIVRMRDNPNRWKIVDGDGKNVAVDFLTWHDAFDFVQFVRKEQVGAGQAPVYRDTSTGKTYAQLPSGELQEVSGYTADNYTTEPGVTARPIPASSTPTTGGTGGSGAGGGNVNNIQTSGTGNIWQDANQNPETWQATRMNDDPNLWKVTDDKGKNIATNFVSEQAALDYIDARKNGGDGVDNSNVTPQPQPNTGGGNATNPNQNVTGGSGAGTGTGGGNVTGGTGQSSELIHFQDGTQMTISSWNALPEQVRQNSKHNITSIPNGFTLWSDATVREGTQTGGNGAGGGSGGQGQQQGNVSQNVQQSQVVSQNSVVNQGNQSNIDLQSGQNSSLVIRNGQVIEATGKFSGYQAGDPIPWGDGTGTGTGNFPEGVRTVTPQMTGLASLLTRPDWSTFTEAGHDVMGNRMDAFIEPMIREFGFNQPEKSLYKDGVPPTGGGDGDGGDGGGFGNVGWIFMEMMNKMRDIVTAIFSKSFNTGAMWKDASTISFRNVGSFL